MISQAWKHRLKLHHPHILVKMPYVIQWLVLGMDGFVNYQEKPRCTFASEGNNCPVVKELNKR